jgi:hypothetical protein
VLDYTKWHRFSVQLDKADGHGWQELTRRAHGQLSGGEKAIAPAPAAVRRSGRALRERRRRAPVHPAGRGLRRRGHHQPGAGVRPSR